MGRGALAAAGADLNALEGQAYDVLTIAAVANDPALVELALEPRWAPGRVLGAYVQDQALVEFRGNIGLWRTPQ